MAEVTATVTLRVVLASGEIAEVTRSAQRHTGDNPRFLRQEVAEAVNNADRWALDGLCASIPGATVSVTTGD